MIAPTKKRSREYTTAHILPLQKKPRSMSFNPITISSRKRFAEELRNSIPASKRSRTETTNAEHTITTAMSSSFIKKRSRNDSLLTPSSLVPKMKRAKTCITTMIVDIDQNNKRKYNISVNETHSFPEIKKSRTSPSSTTEPMSLLTKSYRTEDKVTSFHSTKRAKSSFYDDQVDVTFTIIHHMDTQERLPDPSTQETQKVMPLSILEAITWFRISLTSDNSFRKRFIVISKHGQKQKQKQTQKRNHKKKYNNHIMKTKKILTATDETDPVSEAKLSVTKVQQNNHKNIKTESSKTLIISFL